MATLWEEYSVSTSLSAVGASLAVEIFHNEVDDHLFASAPITVVDGVTTILVTGDDLVTVALAFANENQDATEVAAMQRHERPQWYSFYACRGPLVFRMKSKKTLYPEEKIWVVMRKAVGTAATTVEVGVQLLLVRHQ